jgi:ubiquinone biosynthesis protein UbiJ
MLRRNKNGKVIRFSVAEKQKVSFNITQKCIKYLSNGKYYAKC